MGAGMNRFMVGVFAVLISVGSFLAPFFSSFLNSLGSSAASFVMARISSEATTVHAQGNAAETHRFSTDAKLEPVKAPLTYQVNDAVVTISDTKVEITALLNAKDASTKISDAKLVGKGTLENGVANISYIATDTTNNQKWSGLLLLRISGIGKITGLWMANDQVHLGQLTIGNVVLTRGK